MTAPRPHSQPGSAGHKFMTFVSNITAVLFIGCIGVFFVGLYVAIWSDETLGGRIVATGLVTMVLMACIGAPAYRCSKESRP